MSTTTTQAAVNAAAMALALQYARAAGGAESKFKLTDFDPEIQAMKNEAHPEGTNPTNQRRKEVAILRSIEAAEEALPGFKFRKNFGSHKKVDATAVALIEAITTISGAHGIDPEQGVMVEDFVAPVEAAPAEVVTTPMPAPEPVVEPTPTEPAPELLAAPAAEEKVVETPKKKRAKKSV